jgi:hypothetical protein
MTVRFLLVAIASLFLSIWLVLTSPFRNSRDVYQQADRIGVALANYVRGESSR